MKSEEQSISRSAGQCPALQAPPLRRKRGRGGEPDVSEILRRFKGLLDDGIITQEEFEAKKKQLLG